MGERPYPFDAAAIIAAEYGTTRDEAVAMAARRPAHVHDAGDPCDCPVAAGVEVAVEPMSADDLARNQVRVTVTPRRRR